MEGASHTCAWALPNDVAPEFGFTELLHRVAGFSVALSDGCVACLGHTWLHITAPGACRISSMLDWGARDVLQATSMIRSRVEGSAHWNEFAWAWLRRHTSP
jgi:hypothetical protein